MLYGLCYVNIVMAYIFFICCIFMLYTMDSIMGGANSFIIENAYWVSTLIALITIPLSIITTNFINKTKFLKI